MRKQASDNQGLVPKLRFPEFRDAGEWVEKPLGEFASLISERVGGRQFIPLSITSGVGLISQEEKFGRTIAGQQLKNYLVLRKGDFAYNKSATKLYPQGYAVMYQGDEIGCVPSSIFACFSVTDKSVAKSYINYQLSANLHGRWLSRFTTIGARANGSLNVDDNDLLALPVPLPEGSAKFAEQQKIADCLSSLDALISAETDKLEALRDHKKGLMQQLFPAAGETTPHLRFPDFQVAGEWETLTIGDVASVTTGKRDTQNKVDNGKYPFFVRSQTVERIDSFSFDGEAILTSGDGVGVGKNFHYITGKFDFHQRVYCIYNFKEYCSGQFIYQYFSANFFDHVRKLSAKNSVDSVRMPMITDMPLHLPTLPEQKRIADCLFSIDTLISSQSDRIAALQVHKSGLMQQLFPSPAEVAA